MSAIIGIIVVIGAIVGGYLMEHGNLMVLVQPAEFLIIGGAALGTVLIANPLSTVVQIAKGLIAVFLPSPFSKGFYLAAKTAETKPAGQTPPESPPPAKPSEAKKREPPSAKASR